MERLIAFFQFFSKDLRLSNPWRYKVPALMAVPYFLLLVSDVDNYTSTLAILLSFCTIIGIAGIGYLSNDWSDRQHDKAAGKRNATEALSTQQFGLLLAFFLGLALSPWLWFPMNTWSYVLLPTELILFALYAFPPFRLKERGLAGVLADALYAHVVPALLAAITFFLITGEQYDKLYKYLLVLGAWQLVLGIRNILLHQLQDEQNDRVSGITTAVTQLGKHRVLTLLRWLIVPAEVLLFAAFGLLLNNSIIYFLPAILLYWLFTVFRLGFFSTSGLPKTVRAFAYTFLDDFYIFWMPVVLVVGMVIRVPELLHLLLFHLVFFRNGIVDLFSRFKSPNENQFKTLKNKLLNFDTYLSGLAIHAPIFLFYFTLSIGLYFALKQTLPQPEFLFWQLTLSRFLVVAIALHILLLVKARMETTKQMGWKFLFGTGSAYNLAILRFVVMIGLAQSYQGWVINDLSTWIALPDSARESLPLMGWFIHSIPINPELFTICIWAATICAYMAALGLFTRTALLVHIPLAIYVWGVPNFFGKLNHNQLAVWIPAILAFSACADVLSVDSVIRKWWRKKRLPTAPAIKYALPFKFIWLLLAIIYCSSGLHKLWDSGLVWALSDNAVNQMYNEWAEHYGKIPTFRIDQFPVLAQLGALLTIFWELFYPLLIFHPLLRVGAFFSGNAFHRVTDHYFYIYFDQLVRLHSSYINWHWLFLKVKKLLGIKRGPQPDKYHHQQFKAEQPNFKALRPLLIVGGFLVLINGTFALFSIHSWPFSSYPIYSTVFSDTIDVIAFEAVDGNGQPVAVKAVGKQQEFRWENIRPFEQEIIAAHEAGDSALVQQKLVRYWDLWRTKVPLLQSVTRVNLSIEKHSLHPDKSDQVFGQIFLGTVTPSDNTLRTMPEQP